MSFLLGFVLAIAPDSPAGDDQSVDPKLERDIEVCEYLKRVREFEIRSVESVAVGTREQMLSIRPQARQCKLANRIDGVGTKVSLFDIINADETRKDCLVSWIRTNVPLLEFSEEKLEALVETQHAAEKGLTQ